jgi:hypothetical protein
VTQGRCLTVLLVTLSAVAATTGLATCAVDRERYEDQVYACDVRATDMALECGDGWVCHPGSQLGTVDFCAPACEPGGDQQFCGPDGALLGECDPTAPVCSADMQCLRTSVTANAGLCLPVDVCGRDDECRDPLRSHCLAKVLADLYGAGLAADKLNNMWCLQGNCNELSPCEAGYSCLGGLPMVAKIPPVCVPNCTRNPRSDGGVAEEGLCPRSFVCASEVLASLPYRFCLPGLFGFPCQTDDHCLMGTCQPMGSHGKACSVDCTADDECNRFFHPVDTAKTGVACIGGKCVTAFSVYMGLLCDPNDNRCPDGAECVKSADLVDAGVPGEVAIGEAFCRKPCGEPGDCANSGAARACLNILGYTACVPGVASTAIECDKNDPDVCLKGLQCLPQVLAPNKYYCTIACQDDTQCQTHPWLPETWQCRGAGANRVCAP